MFRVLASALVLVSLLAAPALAQQKSAEPYAPSAVGAEPQSTSATFGDWALNCQRVGDSATATKQCEVAHRILVAQQQTPVAKIALGRLSKAEPLHLIAQLPTNVSFPSVAKLLLNDTDSHPLELAWRRCIPAGCFADVVPSQEQLKALRERNEGGYLDIIDAVGRTIRFKVSFHGLASALDALAKE